MTMIKKWLEAIKNFLTPNKQTTTKRKTNVKRTTRKKSK